MKRFFTLTAIIFFTCTSAARAQTFTAAGLSDALKKNAHSVKREEVLFFDIKSKGTAYFRSHEVITVLDEAGKDELVFMLYTDKFKELEDADIQVFDAAGTRINRYSKKQLYTQSEGEGLVDDGKLYYLTASSGSYPVTVQFDYSMKFNGVLDYPDYAMQQPGESVENSSYTIKVPAELDLRYQQQNTSITAQTTVDGKFKLYQWQIKNQPSIEWEEGSVSRESRYPRILVAPNKFELNDYEGDMTSWKNFGSWYAQLCSKTINLGPERKQFFQDMVKNSVDEKDKIRLIYSYLQNNFRYVSIQLGIGGYKPFDADFTDRKKYGDCKGLSNYTEACLAAVGIKSYPALINAEYNKAPVDPAFPHNGFNHMILCVPLKTDTVWLECTSSSADFGVLGNFTENRNALLITEDGGKLVPTPKSNAADNLFYSTTWIKLADDGGGTAKVELKSSGEFKQDFINYIGEEKKDDQKKFLVYYLGFMQPDDFEINYDKKKRDIVEVNMTYEKIHDFKAGSKLFLNPRIYKLWNTALPNNESRKNDYFFESPFIKTDTTVYQLPDGYQVETLPKTKNIKFEYGSFSSSYTFDATAKTITSTAQLILTQHRIPAAKYSVTKKFFDDVLAEYTEKIVVKKPS
ncbi:MAG: DUF3857 domain-containing protein [Ferruginibacter sp.]